MNRFLTVREAAERTGKSPSSIRRILYPILKDDGHADRSHIQPGVEEARELRLKGENFAWRVSEELLLREVPPEERTEKGSGPQATHEAGEGGTLVAMLQRELDIKNQQIAQQMSLISGLSERLREGNILIGSLQKQLALTDGRATESQPIEATATKAAPNRKGTATPPATDTPKRGVLRRLFRR